MSSRGDHNAWLRKKNLPEIVAFCDDLGLTYEYVNGYEWHIRIEGIMDVFPTRKKYHLIKTNERGEFTDYEELGSISEKYVTRQNSDNHV